MVNVFLIKKSKEKEMYSKLSNIKKEFVRKGIRNKTVCIKVHMGEKGNKTHLRPELVKVVVGVLLDLGCKPFLFDSTTLYRNTRFTVEGHLKTAEENGFSKETIGCPIVVSDDYKIAKTKHLKARVCKKILDADVLIDIAHVKGHGCCGMGGAIKNIGMGGVEKQTKKDIHSFSENMILGEKNPDVLSFDLLLSEGASAVIKGKKCYYINEVMRITKECDCCSNPKEIIAKDVGILYSEDIVAIEKASVDLINKNNKDIFEKTHRRDPYLQIKEAENLKMGFGKYKLIVK